MKNLIFPCGVIDQMELNDRGMRVKSDSAKGRFYGVRLDDISPGQEDRYLGASGSGTPLLGHMWRTSQWIWSAVGNYPKDIGRIEDESVPCGIQSISFRS